MVCSSLCWQSLSLHQPGSEAARGGGTGPHCSSLGCAAWAQGYSSPCPSQEQGGIILSFLPSSSFCLQVRYWILKLDIQFLLLTCHSLLLFFLPSTRTKFFMAASSARRASSAQRALSSGCTLYKLAEQPSSLLLLREGMCGYSALHREEKAYIFRESLHSLMQSYIPERETY